MKNLIVTNPEIFYEKNYDNVILGEWCFLNHESHKILKNCELFKFYHWDDYKKKKKDFEYLTNLLDLIILDLKKEYNYHFNLNYTKRFYYTLLYPWLSKYTIYIYDRWEILKTFSEKNQNLKTNLFKFEDNDFIPIDTVNALYQSNISDWNHWIFGKIIECQNKIEFKYIANKKKEKLKDNEIKRKGNSLFLNRLLSPFSSDKIFIKNFQLPFFQKLVLHFQLGNFIFKPNESNYPNFVENLDLRKKIFKNIKFSNNFEKFLIEILSLSIPKVFLEGFLQMDKILNTLDWPKKPEVILTSYDYIGDEIFKFYTAKNVDQNKSKYIISQHGGSLGILDFKINENLFPNISDKFLSWGHKNKFDNTTPLFFTKKTSYKFSRKKKLDGILIPMTEFEVYPSLPETVSSRRDTIKFLDEFDKFTNILDKKISNTIKIKYRNPFEQVKLNPKVKKGILADGFLYQKERLIAQYKSKMIYTEISSLRLSKNFKLVIELVNGTGFLELLANNIPVILIMSSKNNILNNYAKGFYDQLKDVNIYFEDFKKASVFVNKNYNNIDEWWQSEKLQKIKNDFTNTFAKKSNYKLKELKKVLIN